MERKNGGEKKNIMQKKEGRDGTDGNLERGWDVERREWSEGTAKGAERERRDETLNTCSFIL